jgi:hypothetical protein
MRQSTIALMAVVLFLLVAPARQLWAQDPLGAVKNLYASAAYEDALAAIDKARPASAPPDTRALDQYRAFCLLALGRDAEATTAMEDLIAADPFFVPSETDVSPRVRTLFAGVRRRVLPGIAQQKYAMAKATFDRKEYAAAAEQFVRVLQLLDDPQMDQNAPGVSDLRTLTGGFVELSKASVPPPPPPPKPEPPAPVAPKKAVFDASDTQVSPPAVIRQDLPPYPLTPGVVRGPIPTGVLEIVIDENGRVSNAVMRKMVSPVYDPLVMTAVANWRYKPATADGTPVKYRKMLQINVDRK